MKEVSDQQSVEKKQFESRMKADYKLKKERWKREIADTDAPKRQKEAVLLQQVGYPIIPGQGIIRQAIFLHFLEGQLRPVACSALSFEGKNVSF